MRKFICNCGSKLVRANPKGPMIQCSECRQRYIWRDGAWQKFDIVKEAHRYARRVIREFCLNPPKEFIEGAAETMGQWLKRHGIKKEKKPKAKPVKKKIEIAVPSTTEIIPRERIRNRWRWVILRVRDSGSYRFDKNEHFGKLRGRDIARAAHRDLKRIGIKTRLRFVKNGGAELVVE